MTAIRVTLIVSATRATIASARTILVAIQAAATLRLRLRLRRPARYRWGDRPVPSSNSSAYHSYLVVTDSDWTSDPTGLLIEGGPLGNFVLSSLWGYDTQAPGSGLGAGTPIASDPTLTSNHQAGTTYSGGVACGAVQFLLTQVHNYDTGYLAAYSAVPILPGTYNSNSFTSTLLRDLGASPYYSSVLGSFGSAVFGWVPGWGLMVPGL